MKMFKADFHQVFLAMFCSFFALFYIANPLFAYDKNLLLTPTRVIFEGKTRSTVVKLINPNNKPMSYKVSVISIRMNEFGIAAHVDSPNEEEVFAQKMIRFSPRYVTIGPKVWQTIRLMVRKPKDLPPGEYRTQLRVSPVLKKEPQKKTQGQQENVSINIKYAFSISIPIIVRHGKGDVNLVSNPPKLIKKHEKYFLETNIERTGLYSAFFDIHTFFIPSDKTERIEIGSLKGLPIYSENKNILAYIPVNNKDLLTKGKIEIELYDREKQNKPLIHSKSFEINGMKVFNK